MKHFQVIRFALMVFAVSACLTSRAQLSSRSFIPFTVTSVASGVALTKTDAEELVNQLPRFGLYGIGNTNTESFQNINASGKLSGYIRPYKNKFLGFPFYVDVNFGFNVNASNTDSLLVSTFLFPDVGNNSFSTNVIGNFVFGEKENFYFVSPFFEFANKTIKATAKDNEYKFYTLNTSVGFNFQYLYIHEDKNGARDKISFTVSPYLAWVKVPDPGSKHYKYLFTKDPNSPLTTLIRSWGIKSAFQYNNFQIFADFRTVKGSSAEVPVEGLLGFHPNIGVVLNAEIFEK